MNALKIIKNFLRAENRRDWILWGSLLHEKVEYCVIESAPKTKGKQNYIHKMQEIYRELPDWRFRILHMSGNNNKVVVEFDGQGHFTGIHGGKRYQKVPLRLQAVCIFELRQGKIYRVREYFDSKGFKQQLKAC